LRSVSSRPFRAFSRPFRRNPPRLIPWLNSSAPSLRSRRSHCFNFSLTAYDNNTYSGSILGRSPLLRGKTTTTIPTQLIPLKIIINDATHGTSVTYDASAPDVCVAGNPSTVTIIANSPVFQNNPWTMNGVSIGNTQYIDAFQRAQFWSNVQGTPYHLILQESTLAAQTLTFSGTNVPETCGSNSTFIGIVDIGAIDSAVQNLIVNVLPPTVNVGTFPTFLTKEVFFNTPQGCCALGYHSNILVGGNLQIYAPFGIDTTGILGAPDTIVLSHEMAEAVNDPTTGNPVPPWGQIGQTFNPTPPPDACQGNLEVGDPLTPGGPPPGSNTFVVGGYHLQELAFYSWFYGSTSLGVGAGSKFSDNGTFGGHAEPCPPGGTTPPVI
jgi:hypothetical protein